MSDTADTTLASLNEMLRMTPGVPPNMIVQPRKDQYYLEIRHDGWSPTLHAWTQERTVNLMANAQALSKSPAELAAFKTAIIDGDAAVYHRLAMVTVQRILEQQATFARAGAILGISSPADPDDLDHVRVDRHTAMIAAGSPSYRQSLRPADGDRGEEAADDRAAKPAQHRGEPRRDHNRPRITRTHAPSTALNPATPSAAATSGSLALIPSRAT